MTLTGQNPSVKEQKKQTTCIDSGEREFYAFKFSVRLATKRWIGVECKCIAAYFFFVNVFKYLNYFNYYFEIKYQWKMYMKN